MRECRNSELRNLFSSSDAVYCFGKIFYFLCKSSINLEDENLTKFEVELEKTGIPSQHQSKVSHKLENFIIYSYDRYENDEIVYDIDALLNAKLPSFINKDNGSYQKNIDEIIIIERDKENEYIVQLTNHDNSFFEDLLSFFNLLRGLSSYVSQEGSKFLFWISSVETSGKSVDKIINFHFDADSIRELPKKLVNFRFPIFDSSSLHEHEKIVLFKRSLLNKIDAIESPSASDILRLSDDIQSGYDKEYSAYISKFGLDKSLNELHDKSIDIIGKISDTIQSTALKLLVVPATMLATIFMRQSSLNSYDPKIIFIVIVVMILVLILHSETKLYIDKLEENGQSLLDSIINLNAGANHHAVQNSQIEVKESLESVADKTRFRVNIYKWGSIGVLLIWLLIIYFKPSTDFVLEFYNSISNYTSDFFIKNFK
ncbi:hypothetical protein [Idiomarina xiamenensis]|uniref:Uncharacterized protein n=1 Tax=Idiomarina xiamenensis 10-D-4 TaxID=740709 RepID=K2J8I2_9GAMM|nr:hypothetical protein [Idiomarina xiamenensis]EKE79451.1 hypothetical protein A10D4_12824 [Idiomarina xiamenensis 10-D-4]